MIDKLLDTIKRYKHLVNPVATTFLDATDVKAAPTGRFKLSDDPKTNLALWNSIFVGGTAFPLAYLVNSLANKHHEAKVEDKLDKALVDKLNAMRPRVVADPDLGDTSAFTDLPEKELEQLEELKAVLNKKSSGDDDENTFVDDVGDKVSDVFSDIGKNMLPIAAVPLSVLAGVALSNHVNRERIKKQLADRRVQLRNIQAKLDRKHLQSRGLIKSDEPIEKSASSKRDSEPRKDNSFWSLFFEAPLMTSGLLTAILSIGAYNILRDRDKNLAKLKYLKETQLGSNTLQDTPRIGVIDLPVKPEEVLAIPGDKKQETLIATSEVPKQLDNKTGNRPLLENTEVFEEIVPRRHSLENNKEKDAIF